MCGIFGLSITRDFGLTFEQWSAATRDLFLLSESRGKEAAGLALATRDIIIAHKDSVSAGEMLKTPEFAGVLARTKARFFDKADSGTLAGIGHARLVTNGLQGIDANNQPVRRDDVVIIHNGIVVNVDALWSELGAEGIHPRAEVDTEVIAALIQRALDGGRSPRQAMREAYAKIYGETSIAVLLRQHNVLLLGSNTGSMHYALSKDGKGFFFTSELPITRRLVDGDKAIPGFAGGTIGQVRPGHGAMLRLDTHELITFRLEDAEPAASSVSPMLQVQRTIDDKAERYRDAMKAMRRCTKCILPETMPYIAYDADGVCNYCHTYKTWEKRPESDLEERLAQIRSPDGSPDCIVAFSGGRDSSYGLHLLKTKYGMNPITFSYDWGMVTDLARRNQARICGKLGIEHIWISADIKAKRANIRANVLAWLKKPDLGMIPIFMAGDKQFFWHASKTIESTGVRTSVFCTNRLEKTDFKTGFLGIRPVDNEMRNAPATLAMKAKANLAFSYGSRFLSNPRYINRSVPDTLFAAFSYYGIKQDHLYLFDYIPWDEATINETLIGTYDWEIAPDTPSTWRIGDGTAPFYNYIYWSVAGFTEFDTFRSNQIREGMITRDAALADLEAVNAPRWGAIREYTNLINIDFDEAIRVIDRMPKLYIDRA